MKSIKYILVLVLIITAAGTYSQMSDDWQWMNPKPQGNGINAMDFVNDNIGFAVGAYGTIIKTTDNGVNWLKINSGITSQLMSVDFIDANTGFIGGVNQLLKKTTDGGSTWQSLVLPPAQNFYIMDIKFINASLGYVLGFFQLENRIWKTTDGGATWSTQTTGGANYLNEMQFLDANTGFAVGASLYGEFTKTTNGGADWQPVQILDYPAESVKFLNASTGFAGCEDGRIFKTTDGGNTWTSMWSETSLEITSLVFIDDNTGFGFGTGSVYTKTTNGGNNWYEFSLGVGSIRLYYDAAITPNGTIHAGGSYGAMIRSTNSGSSFISQPFVTEKSISNIRFVNNSTGYATGGFGEGDILKTTNSGASWFSQVTAYTLPIYGISFINAETGYLAGSLTVYKTINGGTNWNTIYTSSNDIYTDVFFTNESTGYVVGSYGKLLKTTNAGANWSSSTVSIPGTGLSSIFFLNDNTGFTVGDGRSAAKTTNGGVNWTLMSVPAPAFTGFNEIFFTDNSTGYISGSGIYKTTDAGATWFQLSAPSGGYNSVQFRGDYGYAVAGDGKIIKSTDAGNSWIVQPTVTANPLYALYFNSDNFVYAGGVLGTMIKTMPMELTFTPVTGNQNGIPNEYMLMQNYPNPFNPVSKIRYQLSDNSVVKLTVFDAAGRIVEELVNNMQNAGTYEVTFNGSNLSSGVYFYRLEVRDPLSSNSTAYMETRKMILIK